MICTLCRIRVVHLTILLSAFLVPGGATVLAQGAAPDHIRLDTLRVPSGFKIDLYAGRVPNARQMAVGEKGTVFVGSRDAGDGQVYALVDADHDNVAEELHVIVSGLRQPSGVAFRDGALYVAEIHRILRFDNIEETFRNKPPYQVVNDEYPRDGWHGWKFIAFGPDDKLYVPVGAPCNVCEPRKDIYATITRINPDGSGLEIYARGVRNSVGFDWHPVTGELWFTDNGRDLLGDNRPPDELNRVTGPGLHFGFPYWHGSNVPDPQFGKGRSASEFTLPAQELDPHVAAIGMRFYTGTLFPEEYRNQIFIAEHGSWNRTNKIGYRVTLVRLKENTPISYEPFAHGWLQGEQAWGRPADVLVMPDGALLVSDDAANCIYRITYSG